MVQLPEPCDANSEAINAGYKTIAEIGKERIRRAGRKILEGWKVKSTDSQSLNFVGDDAASFAPDTGFRVLKIDSSNFAENALAACFDSGLTEETIKAVAARKPMRAVFRDEGYGDDSTRINVEQLFKLVSPNTEVKSL